LGDLDEGFAFALAARLAEQLARAAALRAGAPDRQEALLVSISPRPRQTEHVVPAVVAVRACAPADGPRFRAGHLQFHVLAAHGVVKGQREVIADVIAALGAIAPPPSASSKEIAEAEKSPKMSEKVREGIGVEAGSRGAASAEPLVAISIVGSPLLGVAQNGVSLGGFLNLASASVLCGCGPDGTSARACGRRSSSPVRWRFPNTKDLVIIAFH